MSFAQWFKRSFGVGVPAEFEAYLIAHPHGVENGYGPRLWTAEAIQDETDDRKLAEKGVCLIGASDETHHILLRARDGKVFIVDPMDYQTVDAWFSDVDSLIGLLQLERIEKQEHQI
ncbi:MULTISPECIES: hypothetical protein [unclassified Caballeronia]|uniref:hypothetical protein n=1 Tax=unclassified Caballeronia TaxID=2646786 RepID=UPI0028620B23|nr:MULTISPECIES: hypothetical protein [unclassified Caballeronia]MDR5777129.1 hypothetical protein [Caballeronia sp. LZ002]MDR5798715.1 hypothetical protein [Caballeronia sp. LZ001]MDR5852538.1 hypothetical protein [Caballeronia sp. LZ003]